MNLPVDPQPWTSTAGTGPTLRGLRADGDGAVIHFLHGNGFCGGVYWPFLRRLRPDYGIFLHDIEGHGASDAPPRFSGVAAVAQRIPQVMADQGLASGGLIGMGHSFGAALTLRVAARNPGLFSALVLLDPIVFPPLMWAAIKLASLLNRHPFARAARRRRNAWVSHEEALAYLRGRGIYKGWEEEALHAFVDHAMRHDEQGLVLSAPPALEATIYDHPLYSWRDFRRVQVPILFLYGEHSYPFFPPAARRARDANPGVTVGTVAGGHCFMLENPQASADRVREFLMQVNRAPHAANSR
jgi:pimeloyl-ACP methyl ester carboxylesterase